MHRLAELEHDVVGDIHQRTQAAQAAAPQALLHPQRRLRRGLYTAQDAAEVARTGLRCLYVNVVAVIDARRYRRNVHGIDRRASQRADLARHTFQAQAVAAVRGEVDLDQRIVEAERIDQRLPGAHRGRQVHQALAVLAQTELLRRTEHAERFHAAQLALLYLEIAGQFRAHRRQRIFAADRDIGRAAHHLQRLALAQRHAAYAQLVGIGMLFERNDLADTQVGQPRAQALDRVDLQTGHGQLCNQFVGRNRRVNPFPQPLFAEFHECNFSRIFSRAETQSTQSIIISSKSTRFSPCCAEQPAATNQ